MGTSSADFLTCEVKCGAAVLDVADRQNLHNMTVALRGVVELYKAVEREKELHWEILLNWEYRC